MHRVFLPSGSPDVASRVFIRDEDEIKHISKVLRLRAGEEVELCFDDGREFIAEIDEIDREAISCSIVKENVIERELPKIIDLFQGLPKNKKLDVIVQKATECGVHSIIPVEMERSVAEIKKEKTSSKRERLQEIAKSAASQSKRALIPSVEEALPFKDIFKRLEGYDMVLLCDEEASLPLSQLERKISASESIAVIIGSEGGISDRERELLKPLAQAVSLGNRILRTETAALYILAQLSYILSCS